MTAAADTPQIVEAIRKAVTLARAGQAGEALKVLEALGPLLDTHVRASGLMGTVLTMSGRPEDAVAYFERSLVLDPNQPGVHTDLGNALGKLERHRAAAESFDRALAIDPAFLPALNNRAGQRLELKDGAGALEDADAALAIDAKLPSAHRYRSRALLMLDRREEALAAIERAAALQPDNPDNPSIRAAVLTALGRFAEAAASLDAAVALEPDNANFLQSRAYARLRLRDFAGGWADLEHRWAAPAFRLNSRGPVPPSLIPRLAVDNRRADVAGKRLLVIGEQGTGDQIMFASMLPDLLRDAAAVTCVTSPRMQALFETAFPGLTSLPDLQGVDIDAFDRVMAIGSLGPMYRNALKDFPGAPYLRAREEIAAGWRARLGDKTTPLRVGVSWRGGAEITGGAARSLSLEALRPLLERDDCEFVSLQYGKVQDEIEAFNQTLARPIRSFPHQDIETFEALAGLVSTLDLVVSVQTTIIHLSGALGVPCLVMIPFIPEWRYGATGDTLPWYSSVRLVRQQTRGDWTPVIAAVATAIDATAAGAAMPRVELDALVAEARSIARGGSLDGAVTRLESAGLAVFRYAPAATLMAGLLLRLDRAAEALPYFDALVGLEPANGAAHADRAKALVRLERPQDAAEAFGLALSLAPDDAALLVQRAVQLYALAQHDRALDDLDRALRQNPPAALRAAAQHYRGRAFNGLKRWENALAAFDAALAIEPDNARYHYLRARALTALERPDEARRAFERTVALDPAGDAPRYLLSMAQLRQKDFAEGWPNYERRWRVGWFIRDSNAMVPPAIAPRLDLNPRPEDFDGKSVLVLSEQGVGDQIMFASILPDLAARASKVTFVSLQKLLPLFAASFPDVDFIPPLPSLRLGAFDKVIAVGSLAHAFRNAPPDFPGVPFLAPRPEVAAAWRARLGPKTTPLRVGLSWQGGTDKTSGQKRSIALEQLRPLLERADCEFVSLQYGDVEAEVAAFNATLARPIRIFPKEDIEDFEQLAGLVLGLDMVVSVQTAIIHLSGALGAPCLVMIPAVAEWRYGAEGETMPWYGSVKLLRQIKADDWSGVIDAVGAQLDAKAQG